MVKNHHVSGARGGGRRGFLLRRSGITQWRTRPDGAYAPGRISKLTDGPLSRSQSPPRSRDLLGLSCGWLYPCCGNGLIRFRLAPCLVLWDFKTDGWPPVPIPKPSPQPRPPWIQLRLALPMLRLKSGHSEEKV